MDILLARKLESDEVFQKKVAKLVKDYLQLGQSTLNYWVDEFDAANDILMCYAPLSKPDLENLERGHPKRFVLPMTATQITTMTSFISQALFGDHSPHKVEGRGPEDETPAEHMNQLLRWNAEQQPTYLVGYLWIQDVLTFNRGVMYNSWQPKYKMEVVQEEVIDPAETAKTGVTVKVLRTRKVRRPVGGFCRMDLIAPTTSSATRPSPSTNSS